MHPHDRIAGAVTRLHRIERSGGIAAGKIHGGNGIGTLRPAARITPEPAVDISRLKRRPRPHVEPLDASEAVSSNLHQWRSLCGLRIRGHCGGRRAQLLTHLAAPEKPSKMTA